MSVNRQYGLTLCFINRNRLVRDTISHFCKQLNWVMKWNVQERVMCIKQLKSMVSHSKLALRVDAPAALEGAGRSFQCQPDFVPEWKSRSPLKLWSPTEAMRGRSPALKKRANMGMHGICSSSAPPPFLCLYRSAWEPLHLSCAQLCTRTPNLVSKNSNSANSYPNGAFNSSYRRVIFPRS